MRYPKTCKIDKVVPRGGDRYSPTHAVLDLADDDAPVMVATDGKRLVVVPVTLDDGDVGGMVPTDAIKAAARRRKSDDAVIACNGRCDVLDGPSFARETDTRRFPAWREVVPTKGTETLKINVKLLAELGAAIGAEEVTLSWTRDPDGSVTTGVRVESESGDAWGLQMPLVVI